MELATNTPQPPRIAGTKNRVIKTEDRYWNRIAAATPGNGNHSALCFILSGEFALFTDIASQPLAPRSYAAPTFGALRNIIRRLAPHLPVTINPLGVEFLAKPEWLPASFLLSGGLERKAKHIREENGSLFHPTVLRSPRWRVFFSLSSPNKNLVCAAIQRIQRKIRSGNHEPICLGHRDMPADVSYNNPEEPIIPIHFELPTMLKCVDYETPGKSWVYNDVTCASGRLAFPAKSQPINANIS